MNNKSRTKSFIGGITIGTIIGLLAGGFTVAILMSTLFINYTLGSESAQVITETK